MLDVEGIIKKFNDFTCDQKDETCSPVHQSKLKIIQDPEYKRFGGSIDFNLAFQIVGKQVDQLKFILHELNNKNRIYDLVKGAQVT